MEREGQRVSGALPRVPREKKEDVEWTAGPKGGHDPDFRPQRHGDSGDGDRGWPLHGNAGEDREHRWLRSCATWIWRGETEEHDAPGAWSPGPHAARNARATPQATAAAGQGPPGGPPEDSDG